MHMCDEKTRRRWKDYSRPRIFNPMSLKIGDKLSKDFCCIFSATDGDDHKSEKVHDYFFMWLAMKHWKYVIRRQFALAAIAIIDKF